MAKVTFFKDIKIRMELDLTTSWWPGSRDQNVAAVARVLSDSLQIRELSMTPEKLWVYVYVPVDVTLETLREKRDVLSAELEKLKPSSDA